MKIFRLIFLITILFSCTSQAETDALIALKKNEKLKVFLSRKPAEKFDVVYHQMSLGGTCGFVGCSWRELVSVVVTAKVSNAPTVTIIALIEGMTPKRNDSLKIRFVELEDKIPSDWEYKL